MTIIGKSSKAFYFNGVSDGIICPAVDFKSTGIKSKAGSDYGRSSRPLLGEKDEDGRHATMPALDALGSFSVEAWVRPDCGGVVASKNDLFTLSIGSVSAPAPASFSVTAQADGGVRRNYSISSGYATSSGYSGVTFPSMSHASIGDDDLSRSSAPLIHVAGVFTRQLIALYVNGVVVAQTKIDDPVTCNPSSSEFLIGGRGGQFRGHIESVHWRRGTDKSSIKPIPSIKDTTTLGLWRFEEDADVPDDVFHIKSNASAGDTYVTLDSAQIQTMYRIISGKSDTFTGTYSVPSLGSYKVVNNKHSGGAQVIDVAHTGWNLLINPTSTDIKSGKPNSKAPERVRIASLNASNYRVTVSSVHLDFDTTANTGSRGLLHGRTAFDSTNNLAHDSTCVLLKSDLLIDAGSDDDVQTHGLGSQAIDTTGIMVKDEGPYGLDGYIVNRDMSINETGNAFTVTSGNWGVSEKFAMGHTGRHTFNHVAGHDYLTVFPDGQESVTQNIDGLADVISGVYDGQSMGLQEQVPAGTPISLYKRGGNMRPNKIITTSTAKQVIRNGLSSLDPDRDSIIAIGGSGFDVRPFLLKGTPISGVTQTDTAYALHLTPETESRVAVLETGDADFPLVEIHYNAIDLTGDTMGASGPCLLVEKTVPSGGTVINSKRVAATIASAISSGKTMHAPGGLLSFTITPSTAMAQNFSDYNLVGDNTGGSLYEIELDKSRIPSAYTPRIATDDPQQPPIGIPSSHVDDNDHPSVYHKMIISPNSTQSSTTPDLKSDTGRKYSISAVSGNDGRGNLQNRLYEMFDIITNYSASGQILIVVQPSDRTRSLVLSKVRNLATDPLYFVPEFLISRGRVMEFEEGKTQNGKTLDMTARGLMDDIASMEAQYSGTGAPDSTIVKEVSPDAPVVSVTLGGAGQGAVLTQPTWDKSVLSRLGWSSRRDGAATTEVIENSSSYYVECGPLNNMVGKNNDANSMNAAISFPARGRVYLASGASFEYYKLYQNKFYFHSGTSNAGTGRFLDAEGGEHVGFAAWQSATGFDKGETIYPDDKFDDDSIIPDGTTLNDRLFQQMGGVSHDYQLGTQYSSTRSMVEIPIFSNQFFPDSSAGTFPSPGNSMKLHVDATMTAHTWAPNPVGRRPAEFYPPDRDVEGPYHKRLQDGDSVVAMRVNKVEGEKAPIGTINILGAGDHDGEVFSATFQDVHNVGFTITDAAGTTKNYVKIKYYNDTSFPKNSVISGRVKAFVLQSGGSGYNPNIGGGDVAMTKVITATTGSGSVGSLATSGYQLTINGSGVVTAVTMVSSGGAEGKNHAVGDILTLGGPAGGGGTACTIRVTEVYDDCVVIGNNPATITFQNSQWHVNWLKNFRDAVHSSNGHNGTLVVSEPDVGRVNIQETIFGNQSDDGSIVSTGWPSASSDAPVLTQVARSTYPKVFVEGLVDRVPTNITLDVTGTERKFRGMRAQPRYRRIFRPDGEWGLIRTVTDAALDYFEVEQWSDKFLDGLSAGSILSLLPYLDYSGRPIRDDTRGLSSANEFRRPFYHDRANVQTQGGNVDYGLRQYVSAVEFKAGPTANPHAKRIQTGVGTLEVVKDTGAGNIWVISSDTLPITKTTTTFTATNSRTGAAVTFTHNTASSATTIVLSSGSIAVGDTLILKTGTTRLNRTWNYPYAPGGLRSGDTVWMNMHYTNPHAIDGMFCKSRGVFNEYEVWSEFNGGKGGLGIEASDTLPLENFLIGDTCRETAINFVQHVNKTVSLNWQQLGYSSATAPTVAFIDPYLDTDGHARVLLYDVAHDREFIAFHDLLMQVQTSQATPQINGLDVAAGFRSQINTSNRSTFIESAYAHRSYFLHNPSVAAIDRDDVHPHYVTYGSSTIPAATGRLSEETVSVSSAESRHEETTSESASNYSYNSTFFDTPDGTRAIPAFLCLKGIRNTAHDLSSHSESRLENLPHWKNMDFVRRHEIDFGSVAMKDGVADIQSAAEEIVRQINQSAALKATKDGGSAHDPAAFWDPVSAGTSDRGTHMGYVRAHLGRSVKDLDGNEGYSIIIHSTIPGASGRNFCVWLDNSTGQVPYKPEYLIGHGGRFRSQWCLPVEGQDENMHPAPMPITKNGRPFAPITTLRQLVPSDDEQDTLEGNLHFGYESPVESAHMDANDEMTVGRIANTVYGESFESQGQNMKLVEGLRTGTRAQARVNFGGLVASGIPGWAPDAGKWGFGEDNSAGRFDKIYNPVGPSAYSAHVPNSDKTVVSDRQLYGLRFTDHRAVDHTIRFIYKQAGQKFAGKYTQLPTTLENEVLIYFDDRDVSQGGFTLGKHMRGSIHPDRDDYPAQSWRGNLWKAVKSPANAYACTTTKSGDAITVTLLDPMPDYTDSANGGGAIDILGFLGFPESGLLSYTDTNNSGHATTIVRYTSRTKNSSGTHTFYGISGPNFSSNSTTAWGSSETAQTAANTDGSTDEQPGPVMISPSLNWTSLLTDEVIAAAVEHAMLVNPNDESHLDISDMYATDGRTFREWMGDGAKTAVTITTLNDKQEVTPLRDLFSVTRRRDLGLLASCLESSTAGTEAFSLAEIESGKQNSVGYIPHTLLDITSNGRGPNANTATPVLINSANQAVDTTTWKQNLQGDRYQFWPGDHIIPHIETHVVQINTTPVGKGINNAYSHNVQIVSQNHGGSDRISHMFMGGPVVRYSAVEHRYRDGQPKRYVERRKMYLDEELYITAEPRALAATTAYFCYETEQKDSDSKDKVKITSSMLPRYLYSHLDMDLDGYRLAGNEYGEPLTYFRGGQESPDHSVPLYFGGGFSGLVMDINDGTQNDYTEVYSHPYASGPTGCSGLQQVGENMGSHAILDTTAMLAMFPGTGLLNQHRGENTPPFMNVDAVLAPDLKAGNSAQTLGISGSDKTAIFNSSVSPIPLTHPSPVVLRFAHPYARYSDTANEVAYIVFGPGQSVPKHYNQYTGAGTVEPASSQTVANKVTHVQRDSTNVYFSSGTTPGLFLPNMMGVTATEHSASAIFNYMPPSLQYQKTCPYPYGVMRNWEPAYGAPSSGFAGNAAEDARLVTGHFGDAKNNSGNDMSHPFSHGDYNTRWHMDGGFPAGGNWFDYAVRKNPPHPTTSESTKHLPNSRTHSLDSQTITLGLQASMFRVGYLALTTYDSTLSETDPPRDVFIVDATRVQNSEELGAVISAAVNSYPGEGNLKAIGGTFLPSFQDAVRQDRYSWVDIGNMSSYDPGNAKIVTSQTLPPSIPANGWLRLKKMSGSSDGSNTNAFYGYYSSFTATTGGAPIASLAVNAGGSGYNNSSTVSFSGGGGSSAAATATVTYAVASLSHSGGSGAYSASETDGSLTFSGGGGSGAAGTFTTSNDGANIASLAISNAGTGYTHGSALTASGGGGSNFAGTITVGRALQGTLSVSGGASQTAASGNLSFSGGSPDTAATGTWTATSNGAALTGVSMTNNGTGYSSAPTVSFSGGGGSNAAGTATVGFPLITGGGSNSFNITTGSGNSVDAASGSLSFSGGGGSGAAGTWTGIGQGAPIASVSFNTGSSSRPVQGTDGISAAATISGGDGTNFAGTWYYGYPLHSTNPFQMNGNNQFKYSGSFVDGYIKNAEGNNVSNATITWNVSATAGDDYGKTNTQGARGTFTTDSNGKITGISVTTGGQGFMEDHLQSETIVFTMNTPGPPPTSGYTLHRQELGTYHSLTPDYATDASAGGTVMHFHITNAGSGYTSGAGLPTIAAHKNTTSITPVLGNHTSWTITHASLALTNAGQGYTSNPTVTLNGGTWSGSIYGKKSSSGGQVKSVTITNAGSGYSTPPTVSFSGGGGSNAAATAAIGTVTYTLASATITNGGAGYTSVPTITTGGGGTISGASLASTGYIKSTNISNAGSGYTSDPTIAIAGGGSNGSITPTRGTETRSLSGVTLTNGGSGYSSAPSVSIDHGTVTATLATTGAVTGISLTNAGSGYTSAPTVSVSGGNGASIGVTLQSTSFFTLGANYRSGTTRVENPRVSLAADSDAASLSDTYKILVWSKAGNLRWSNGGPETTHNSVPSSDTNSIYDQLAATQVHFSGLVDAIDRTRPIGAVGWHGERYSKLNSLVVPGTSKIASGLGAWHPMLGTNPYGGNMGCHAQNGFPFTTVNDTSYTPVGWNGAGEPKQPTGLHPRHYVILSYEGELPIVARADRDGLLLAGDMLDKKWNNGPGGTVEVSHAARHNNDRFVAYAHGGPHVDAQFATGFAIPSSGDGEWASDAAVTNELMPMETCIFPTGDLFFDTRENPGVKNYPNEAPLEHKTSTLKSIQNVYDDPFSFWGDRSAARNFLSQHVVWKRMDGGNLCMPASNARGLGGVPWVWRKVGGSYVKFGETIYGNNRFSFESTNSAMFPVIQAQELSQPHLAEQFPIDLKNALAIPNEEIQFEAITVIDDAGEEHKVEGGSPFGTIIRDFQRVSEREVKGPALAGSGNKPVIEISKPDADAIPGNVVVRSGFDKVQAYQHESMGTGGLQRPDLPDAVIKDNFDSQNTNPETAPFYENRGYERIDTRADEYPNSRSGDITDQSFLETSYEPHDRALYFHLTKKGFSYTERQPLGFSSGVLTHNPLTFTSVNGAVVTANTTVNADIWRAEQLPDGRSFFTVNGHVVSFTGVSGSTFTGCKYSSGFAASSGDTLLPSFFVPSGTTRHFAARRLRDHAEVSGESPDKKPIDWMGIATNASPATAVRSDRLTPMPLPRMGHNYITPTMAMMPGHLSHPLYQKVYKLNRAYYQATTSLERELGYDKVGHSHIGGTSGDGVLETEDGIPQNVLTWFSSTSAPHPPSDIHGSGFTLMTETKMRYDGYGILAYDAENTDGDHRLKLEVGTNYSTHWNFPDPMETGAYQIIIQPNLYSQQLMGFNDNYDFGADSGTKYPLLTDAQVATVIALQWNGTAYDFILSHALKADVRGCEVYLNEVMLDIDPSPNQQFTNLPPLALYNPLGINENTSPVWSRKSLPYRPGMFRPASPGYTLTVPWWAPALKSSTALASTNAYRMQDWSRPEDYYLFSKSGYGSIGSQMVMNGYPSYAIHPYTHSYMSYVPKCKVVSADQGNNQIVVDNNALFPEVGKRYVGNRIVVTGTDGQQHKARYGWRGVSSGQASQTTNVFYDLSPDDATLFYAACTAGAVITLTGEHDTLGPGEIFTNREASVFAHHIESLQSGSQDTQTSHLPDAFLSMWHYNLGRPMTFYSDSRNNIGDAAVDKKPYNHLPEHFETIRYQNFTYVISDGPFDFRGYVRDVSNSKDASISPDGLTDANAQARKDTSINTRRHHYGSFWPGGSRFGAQASDLALWGTAAPGWGRFWDSTLIYQESGTAGEFGVQTRTAITDSINSTNHKRPANFGYRFCIRQAPNRPRWALWSTQAFDDKYTVNNHSGYRFGVYVQNDQFTTNIYTSTSATSTATRASGYAGMLERVTNASALVGSDLKLQQVRYSHGRRMTRPFGCAVRNYVAYNVDNDTGGHPVLRAHQGDYLSNMGNAISALKSGKRSLAPAIAHYMTDWWGNTTGEEVRRFPVRGFGVRPAWDPEDAYRATDRTISAHTFAAPHNQGLSRANLDAFNPATAKRVGDRGDGRGVRWPTAFNEDVLQDIDVDMQSSGLVLSHSTAEPSTGVGYVRPRNDAIQENEVDRGISRRLDAHATDGLLKPEAMAGSNVEKATADLLPASEGLQEPVSRIGPRIGLDVNTVGEINNSSSNEYVALATEAHSLHTDRGAGKRYVLAAGVKTDTRAIDDYRLDSLNFSNFKQVMRLNHTHGIWPLGGNLVLDLMNYMEPVSDQGWGTSSGSAKSSNPYQSSNHNSMSYQTNEKDTSIKFLLRPVRVLDHRHIEIFRDQTNALSGTAGGRYGVFTYNAPNARAATSSKFLRATNPTPTNAPYPPSYFFTSSSYTVPSSVGPRLPGSESSSFSNSLKQSVARIIVANNTLQHLRGDAARSGDFSIQPRYTQSIYPGDDLNKSDHSSESSRNDNEVNG